MSRWQTLVLLHFENDITLTSFSFSPFWNLRQLDDLLLSFILEPTSAWQTLDLFHFGNIVSLIDNNLHSLTKGDRGKFIGKFILSISKYTRYLVGGFPKTTVHHLLCVWYVLSRVALESVLVQLFAIHPLFYRYVVLSLSLPLCLRNGKPAVHHILCPTSLTLLWRFSLHALRYPSVNICAGSDFLTCGQLIFIVSRLSTGLLASDSSWVPVASHPSPSWSHVCLRGSFVV